MQLKRGLDQNSNTNSPIIIYDNMTVAGAIYQVGLF